MEAQSVAARRGHSGLALPRSRRLLAPLSDERLVDQVRRGNDVAFEVIYDRHHRGILAFCRHMLSSVEEAEDAIQHTFIQAHDSIVRGDRELKLKAWLYTIARNRCLSILRARREQAAELDELPTAGLSEEVQQRTELRDMLADIRELPEDQRAALVLSELGDLSHVEIANVVGCEASKVKSLVFQARSSLIESRNAREIPCHEIREQLATASGGVLRRGPLRRHLKHCEGCAEFRDDVKRQRRMMAAALPVIPSVALKHSALAAVGIGTGGASAAGGSAAAGGGLASLLGSGGAGKAIALLAVAGATVGSGVAVTETVVNSGGGSESASPAQQSLPAPAAPAATQHRHSGTAQRHGGASHAGHRGSHGGAGADSRGHRGSTGASHGSTGRHHGRGRGHASPHAGGQMLFGPTDHNPGVTPNGHTLPPTSNGGYGGGNNGRRANTSRGGSTAHGNAGGTHGQGSTAPSGTTTAPRSPSADGLGPSGLPSTAAPNATTALGSAGRTAATTGAVTR